MSKNKKFLIGLFIGLFLAGGLAIFAAPVGTVLRSILPETNNQYYLGTTSPRTYWANVYTQTLTVTSGTATTTINAGDILATFGYPFTGQTSSMNATTSSILLSAGGIFASSTSMLASTTIQGSLNIGTLTATSGTSYLNALSLGTKLPNAQLANSSIIINTSSPLGGGATANLGDTLTLTCSTCATFGYPFTILSSTLNSTSTILSFTNGIASTSILGSLNIGTLTATSGTSYLNALSLGTVLTVANGGTGAGTFTSNGVLYGNGTGALLVTGQGPANSILIANAGAPSFSASPTITNLSVTASSTFSGLVTIGGNATTSGSFFVTAGDMQNNYSSSSCSSTPCTPNFSTSRNAHIQITGNTAIDLNGTSTKANKVGGGYYSLRVCNLTGSTIGNGAGDVDQYIPIPGNSIATTTYPSTALSGIKSVMEFIPTTQKWEIMASTTITANNCMGN